MSAVGASLRLDRGVFVEAHASVIAATPRLLVGLRCLCRDDMPVAVEKMAGIAPGHLLWWMPRR
jgi:hypothetical protein